MKNSVNGDKWSRSLILFGSNTVNANKCPGTDGHGTRARQWCHQICDEGWGVAAWWQQTALCLSLRAKPWLMSGGEDDSLSVMGLFAEEQRYRFWMGWYPGQRIMGQTETNKRNRFPSVIHLYVTRPPTKRYLKWSTTKSIESWNHKRWENIFLLVEETILEL